MSACAVKYTWNIKRAFCRFVRPILEHRCIIWNPVFKRDINKVESVQRRFAKRLNIYITR